MRSSGARSDRVLAVEVQQCPLSLEAGEESARRKLKWKWKRGQRWRRGKRRRRRKKKRKKYQLW